MSYEPCPPRSPAPCAQVCPPPPPMAPCRSKPIMRGLHWSQTTRIMTHTFVLCAIGGTLLYTFVGRPRIAAYKDYYMKAEFDDYVDEMERKGLFQAVKKENIG